MSSSLFNSADELLIKYGELAIKFERERERNKYLEDEKRWLLEQIAELKRSRYGTKSEGWDSPDQLCFNEAEALCRKPEPPGEDQVVEVNVKGHVKKIRGHRRPLPENLEREIVKIELPLDERVSEDGLLLKVIGWEISEKLKYEPAKVSVIQYHRAKYGVESGDYEKTAPPFASLIPKGIATPQLLAAIVTGKYANGMPLYRLEEIFRTQNDIHLSRTTMARWMIKVGEALQPIWNVLSDKWRESPYVAMDETHVQVLNDKGKKLKSKGWMLVRSTPFGAKKVVLFDYSPTRSQEVINNLTEGFRGFFQCDGLNVYDKVDKQDEVIRLGCNMHGRRRFEQAAVIGAKHGKSLGEEGLGFYKSIYDLEEEIRGLDPNDRYRIRQEKAQPIWDEMKIWAGQHQEKVPIKSKIGEAFRYFTNEYDYLSAYLKDGRLECDNGFTERAIRKFAIGRNNWLFSDEADGAHASSVLYSIVITAKINGVNPYQALVKLIDELPRASTVDDYERLAEIILAP